MRLPTSDPGRTGAQLAMSVASRLVPGIGRVHAQVAPYAAAWQLANAEALQQDGPLWVALGDSMSQGIGAQSTSGGWVGQLHARLQADGRNLRLVNLSVTGARVRDVLDEQLPRLQEIGIEPELVTVLVGANDMVMRCRRAAAVDSFAMLLDRLPAQRTVIGSLPRRNPPALAINALIDSARVDGTVRVAEMHAGGLSELRGTLAEDFFHPNERGYRRIADAFAAALEVSDPLG